VTDFTVPCVPTGMKIGVSTTAVPRAQPPAAGSRGCIGLQKLKVFGHRRLETYRHA
jgi:hypothetical protein